MCSGSRGFGTTVGAMVEGGHALTVLNAPEGVGCCSPRALPLTQLLGTLGEGDQGTWRDHPSLPSACFQFPEGSSFQEWEPLPRLGTTVIPRGKAAHEPPCSQASAGRSPEVSTPPQARGQWPPHRESPAILSAIMCDKSQYFCH